MSRPIRHLLRPLAVLLGTAAFTVCSTLALAQSEMDLPAIGEPAGAVMSKNDEYAYGMMVEREMRAEHAILDDPESQAYIQALGTRLAAQSQMGAAGFHYYIVNDPSINATTVPYFIFCNYGTILAMQTESELAGVLAHETAHVTQHHITQDLASQGKRTLTMAAEMIAAILLGAVGGGAPAIEGGIAAAQGLEAQSEINFTRVEEAQADAIGMQYLSKAGFNPEGMANAFELLEQRYGYEMDLIPKFLQNHPVTSDRIADARARAAQLPHPTHLPDPIDFELIRERLRVITAPVDFDLLAYYHQRLADNAHSLPDLYGEAIAYLHLKQPQDAVKVLAPLVDQHQSVTLLRVALGQAQVAAGEVKQGLATFAIGERLFPRDVPLTVRYSQALIKTGHPKQAHDLLNDLFNVVQPTPRQIQLIARAASDAGDKGDAYDYMGEYYISNGNLPLASQQLERALKVPHITYVQRERFEARLTEVRDVIAQTLRETRGQRGGNPQGGQLGGLDLH